MMNLLIKEEVETIKEQIKSLSEKENYFNIGEAEPNFEPFLTQVSFAIDKNENSFDILDTVEMGKLFKTINYSDVEKIEIDSILVSIILKDGCIYCLHEVREDIADILKDFDDTCMITKYKTTLEDGKLKYHTKYYTYIEEFEVYDDEEDNTVKISNDVSTYIFDYSEIFSVEEQYDGDHRLIQLVMMNEELITLESM